MIDLFKKVVGYYASCYIVKYTPVVGQVVQEKFNKEEGVDNSFHT